MHIPSNLSSSTIFLLAILSGTTNAVLTARVQAHFYSACPSSIPPPSKSPLSSSVKPVLNSSDLSSPPAPPAYRLLPDGYNTDLLAQQIDIHPGVCQNIFAPSFHRDQVDHVSVEAILTQLGEPFQQCNITVHEVPGCVDPALLTAQFMNGSAVSPCIQRNFAAYSQVWVQMNCGEVGTGTGTAAALTQNTSLFNAATTATATPETSGTQLGSKPAGTRSGNAAPQLETNQDSSSAVSSQQQQLQQIEQPTTLIPDQTGNENDKASSHTVVRTITTTTTTTVRLAAAGTATAGGCDGIAVRKRVYLRRKGLD